jgi:hypothetical protein
VAVAGADVEVVQTVAPSRVGREPRLHVPCARARGIIVPRTRNSDPSIDVHFPDEPNSRSVRLIGQCGRLGGQRVSWWQAA